MSKFANRLKSLRKEKGLTQNEISALFNLSRSTYSGWEVEGKEPDTVMLCTIANFFGVTCDYLLGNSDERTPAETVFCNDHDEFRAHYENLPADLKMVVAKTFDSFYLLLNRDMQLCRPERLELYQKLLSEIQRLRASVRNHVESSGEKLTDAVMLSDLMALQSELKNTVSTIFDELLQADMEIAFQVKKDVPGASSEKMAM